MAPRIEVAPRKNVFGCQDSKELIATEASQALVYLEYDVLVVIPISVVIG
jgi:hypothetical protein